MTLQSTRCSVLESIYIVAARIFVTETHNKCLNDGAYLPFLSATALIRMAPFVDNWINRGLSEMIHDAEHKARSLVYYTTLPWCKRPHSCSESSLHLRLFS